MNASTLLQQAFILTQFTVVHELTSSICVNPPLLYLVWKT